MQLQTILLAGLALATGATADRVLTTTTCNNQGLCTTIGKWYNNSGGVYNFNPNEGCRNPGVPYIYNVCMDWTNLRAHFDAENQPKRCLKAQPAFALGQRWWEEVACTW